jgi:hypothetical protein
MDPITAGLNFAGGVIGKGGFFDQLFYSEEEKARDANGAALANVQLENIKFGRESLVVQRQAQAAQIAANQKLGLMVLAGVAVLAAAYIVSRSS